MVFDNISIIGCVVIVLLVTVSSLMNPFFRKLETDSGEGCDNDDGSDVGDEVTQGGGGMKMPPVTVLVMAHNKAKSLDAHLPIILTQDYAPGFEVIVVGEQGDLQVEAAIAQFKQCRNLYATYVPKRSLFMSKAKLCVALGVKAAHNEWIVLVDSESKPVSDNWLKSLAVHMTDSSNLVIGYSNYVEEAPGFYRFYRLLRDCYIYRNAQRSTAYRANGTNIAFRRSEFIDNDGYRGSLQFVSGEYDFIVTEYARQGSAQTALCEDAFVREDEPTEKGWNDRNVFFHHIRKRLDNSCCSRWLYNTDITLMYLNYGVIVGVGTLAGIMKMWILLGVAVVGLLATILLRCRMASRRLAMFGEEIPSWRVFFYELSLPWHGLATRIRYAKSDKADFTTHKL